MSGDAASRQVWADELAKQGRHAEAIEVYRSALTGLYEFDPKLMLGLAGAQFAGGEPAAARATLELLIEKNPAFMSPDGHLLYARAVEARGDKAKALEEIARNEGKLSDPVVVKACLAAFNEKGYEFD